MRTVKISRQEISSVPIKENARIINISNLIKVLSFSSQIHKRNETDNIWASPE
jgi:hypothetical protein